MTHKEIHFLINQLQQKGVSFDKGLSEEEIKEVENTFAINFPPDLNAFLQTQLPVSGSFVHWRYGINSKKGKEEITYRLNGPIEGIYFDIRHNDFWWEAWGEKPKTYEEQKAVAFKHLLQTPRLIPIYSHRYIPTIPNEAGNPVFSVYQTDIIYYGKNLADYLANEFQFTLKDFSTQKEAVKTISFWSELVS